MDIGLLKTFLEVRRIRHFGRAAEGLFVTQAAVSARIKRLEELLGVSLFDRSGKDISLTPEGHRLVRYAELLVAEWRRAEQEVAFGDDEHDQLAVAGVYSMWDFLLQDWMNRLSKDRPNLALLADALGEDVIQSRILHNALDIGFVFEPPILTELMVENIAKTELILVSSSPDTTKEEALNDGYVFVDWGVSFEIQHNRLFPDAPIPKYRMGRGRMAKSFITENGGSAYLTERTAREGLEENSLFFVQDAPIIEREVYAIYLNRSHKSKLIAEALKYFNKYQSDSIVSDFKN